MHGPFFNDEFGDTFGTIYAFTGDGYSLRRAARLRRRGVRNELLRVPDVNKVELIGVQDEKIYIETSHRKLASLGIDPLADLQRPAARRTTWCRPATSRPSDDRICVRVSGDFDSVESIREIGIQADGRLFRLGDIAEVKRGFVDPPRAQDALQGAARRSALAIAMRKGGDVIRLGEPLKREMAARWSSDLPVGIEVHAVADQPTSWCESVTSS